MQCCTKYKYKVKVSHKHDIISFYITRNVEMEVLLENKHVELKFQTTMIKILILTKSSTTLRKGHQGQNERITINILQGHFVIKNIAHF